MTPLAIDLFCGLGGWTDGLLAEGYRVVGFDRERHVYGEAKYPAQLVLQDVLTIHGKQFKDAALIVASPPCQEFSYMAMPWSRAKEKARALRDGRDDPKRLTALFDACFRIQREAIAAAGHHIPLVVENVRGAQPWVGRARWNFGSFYLWGDVPALMPMTKPPAKQLGARLEQGGPKWNRAGVDAQATKNNDGSWFAIGSPGQKELGRNPVHEGTKTIAHANQRDGHTHTRHLTNQAESDHLKQPGIAGPRTNGKGDRWFQDGAAQHGSKSNARKAASAAIAKIPFALSSWIAKCYHPSDLR